MSRNQRRNRRNTKSGGSQSAARNRRESTEDRSAVQVGPRPSTETKSSLKTSELVAYAGAVLAVVMTALAVDATEEGGTDPFGAESAIRYITYLTIGYMVARGLAKSGSQENRVEHHADGDDAGTLAPPGPDELEDVSDERDDDVEVVDSEVVLPDEVEDARAHPVDSRP